VAAPKGAALFLGIHLPQRQRNRSLDLEGECPPSELQLTQGATTGINSLLTFFAFLRYDAYESFLQFGGPSVLRERVGYGKGGYSITG
jgi:hypothetical protein